MSGDSSFRIRSMAEADLDRLVEIAAGVDHAPQWPRRAYEAVLDSSFPQRVALVAEDPETGGLAGFVVASLVPPEAELESIAVSAAYQRRGVARRLFGFLAGELGQCQVREVLLEVRESNQSALAFYTSLGFVEEGRRYGYYDEPVEDAILMRLKLCKPPEQGQIGV
ncbi:MAG: ribosomal protein S18-alanine N-acetyltransferase [Terracidiphilus sp.]